MRLLLVALLCTYAVQASIRIRNERHTSPEEMNNEMGGDNKYHDWLSADQKAELKALEGNLVEFKKKTVEFYDKLDDAVKTKWNKVYKKECTAWVKTVTNDAEFSEYKELEDSNAVEADKKREEYKTRLSAEAKAKVDTWKDECDSLLSSRRRRNIGAEFAEFTAWMTDEQRKTLSDMKESGKDTSEIRSKAKEYFNALSAEEKTATQEKLKGKCKAYFSSISTEVEIAEIKDLYESGNEDKVEGKVSAIVGRQTGDAKVVAEKMSGICADVFEKPKKRRDVDNKIEKHLSWLTEAQKKEVREMYSTGKTKEEIRNKIYTFISELAPEARKAAKDHSVKECYAWLKEAASEEEIAALHKMHETDHAGCKKKVREYLERLPKERQAAVEKTLPFCEKVWYGDHAAHHDHAHHHKRKRHIHAIEKHLDWLTNQQKQQIETLEKDGVDFDKIIEKVKAFFADHSDVKKDEIKAKFKEECGAWVKRVATAEELEELKNLKEADNLKEIDLKLTALESRLTEDERHTVEHTKEVCVALWTAKASRKRRDHHHTLEEGLKKWLTWTTEEQKAELKSLEADGKKEELYKKIMEFYAATTGETKTQATEELKGACKHYATDLFGEEKTSQIKDLKESGASHEDIQKKIEQFVGEIEDETKKAKALKLVDGCGKIYKASVSRKRRDHHHTLEESFGKWLTWTTEEQKTELKGLETSGGNEAIYKKIMEFYEVTTGETHTKAKEELKSACKHYAKDMFGEAKTSEIKALKESGASTEAITKKLETFVEELEDDKKKEKAMKLIVGCKKLFDESRKRRDHHHTLEEGFSKWLTWTTEEQKTELKELDAAGKDDELHEKILEFYTATSGETKAQATEELKGACKHYAKDVFGEEKTNEIKALKDAGGSDEAIEKKVAELIVEITDEKKKAKAQKLADGCRKVFKAASRKRRDHHHTLEEGLNKWLTWTTEEQKTELKSLEADGKKEELYKKIMEFYGATTGETKTQATEELKGACKHYATDLFGEEKTSQIKDLKESGASHENIQKKIEQFVGEIEDETKKAKALKLVDGCGKIYKVSVSRKRRDHHHTLEEGLNKWLTWTTEEQKTELKSLEADGKKEELYKKIMEFYAATSGETKTQATEELKGACKHYATDLFGEEKTSQIKDLKESGASDEAIEKKIKEFVGEIEDDTKKSKALKLVDGCGKIYAASKTKRSSRSHKISSEELKDVNDWFNDYDKIATKEMLEAGNRKQAHKKIEGLVGKKLTKKLSKFCMNMVPGESYDDELLEICQLFMDSKMSRARRHSGEISKEVIFGNKLWMEKWQVQEVQKFSSPNDVINKITQYYREMENKARSTPRITATCRAILSKNGDTDRLIDLTVKRALISEINTELDKLAAKSTEVTRKALLELCKEAYKNVHIPSASSP